MKKVDATTESIGLETRRIFLDTQVFRAYGHNLKAGPLRTLRRYIDDGILKLHVTDFTLAEVSNQLDEMQNDLVTRANKLSRELERWNGRFRHYHDHIAVPEELRLRASPCPAYQEFEWVLLHEWNVTQHKARDLTVANVMDQYFSKKPPFDKANSKEFPDAFALDALRIWCERTNERMYVVTKDKALQRAVDATPRLILIDSIDQLLSVFTAAQEHDAAVNVTDAIKSKELSAALTSKISENLNQVGAIYHGDKHEGEVYGLELIQLEEIDDVDVLRIEEGLVSCIVHVRLFVSADVSYEDINNATWDKEDGIYYGGQNVSVEVADLVDAKIFVEIMVTDGEYEIDTAQFITRDLTITDFDY